MNDPLVHEGVDQGHGGAELCLQLDRFTICCICCSSGCLQHVPQTRLEITIPETPHFVKPVGLFR